MEPLPPLEHTSNDTGRLLIYHIQHGDNDKGRFYLYKSVILQDGQAVEPVGFEFACNDFKWLHAQMIKQAFYPLAPHLDDDPRILMTYV